MFIDTIVLLCCTLIGICLYTVDVHISICFTALVFYLHIILFSTCKKPKYNENNVSVLKKKNHELSGYENVKKFFESLPYFFVIDDGKVEFMIEFECTQIKFYCKVISWMLEHKDQFPKAYKEYKIITSDFIELREARKVAYIIINELNVMYEEFSVSRKY